MKLLYLAKCQRLHYEENPPFAIMFSLIMEAEKLFRYPQWKLLWVTKSLKTLKVFCLECFAVYAWYFKPSNQEIHRLWTPFNESSHSSNFLMQS